MPEIVANWYGRAIPATAADTVAVGTSVHLVSARGEHWMATVTRVYAGQRIVDLTIDRDDVRPDQIITSSPFDSTGKRPDSWHFPE